VKVIAEDQHFPGRERDQQEVRGYYAALDEVERLAGSKAGFTEKSIQALHALVMGGGKTRAKPTPYPGEQNVIRDSRTRSIVYMPPEAKFVPVLMAEIVVWINAKDDLPVPLKAAIARHHPPILRWQCTPAESIDKFKPVGLQVIFLRGQKNQPGGLRRRESITHRLFPSGSQHGGRHPNTIRSNPEPGYITGETSGQGDTNTVCRSPHSELGTLRVLRSLRPRSLPARPRMTAIAGAGDC
jgi:hypothetical protein